ncbi:hypothetical protein ETA_29160 [Erwinia tasmaniensis Et1/99]|uniref:Uncharacterized protein n=1 Tax=Erwinia tasmaniensis (strain DSM 17950 / CFBP 7177 / CIP 109463 / NCPPB 4357 / Et1/99) TaxID=465817 RepID=B2VDC4_ERWT9|nr:hypothetical protein ETA_29160 [Erwinia tasmaniensis Et1/99]
MLIFSSDLSLKARWLYPKRFYHHVVHIRCSWAIKSIHYQAAGDCSRRGQSIICGQIYPKRMMRMAVIWREIDGLSRFTLPEQGRMGFDAGKQEGFSEQADFFFGLRGNGC